MRNTIGSLTLMSLSLCLLVSCGRKSDAGKHASSDWPSMEAFHDIMSQAYHPFRDSANLAPLKRLAGEMAMRAGQWQADALPDRVNNETFKGQLQDLNAEARKLADMVNAGSPDAEIGVSLTSLHEDFHEIMELWNGEHEEEREH